MKHVGVNVAADPLFTASYTGVCGGLVLVTADDPEMHSSQNEQDNRNYAFAAKVPMFEPSDPMEAKEMLKAAFTLSEELDTPVMFRITTRVAHVKGVVTHGEKMASHASCGISKVPSKLVMLPSIAKKRREVVEERMAKCRALVETTPFNVDAAIRRGFITSGSLSLVKGPGGRGPQLGICWRCPNS
jgi:indolepyruvate ferredoxin oxidoreductase alpha subunit